MMPLRGRPAIEPVTASTEPALAPPLVGSFWMLAVLWCIVLLMARAYLAGALELFGDEAFYRWESLNLAWSYSDLPPLTAFCMAVGRQLFGDSDLALRSLFLASGLALPGAVYLLARPFSDQRGAVLSALLSLLLPATATIGVLAVPDALLLTECTLFVACLDRAVRTEALLWWVAGGFFACLGFLTHYRFVFLPLSLGLAFLCYPGLRRHLAGPGPWLVLVLGLIGLLPALWFNLGNDFDALGFHFSRRHPWSFHSEGLRYPLQQAVAASPLLYVFTLLALCVSLRRAVQGDLGQALLSSASLFYLVGLSLLAPWVDQTSTTIHWAWFGYIPMLVVLPSLLISGWQRGRGWRWLIVSGLATGAVFVLGSLAMMMASLHFDALPRTLQDRVSVKMVGWDALRDKVGSHYVPGETLYSSGYYLAAQLRQEPFLDSGIIVLDEDKVYRDGRARQLYLWQVSERFMPADGSSGLIVMDFETANRQEVYRQIDVLCRRFQTIETLEEFSWYEGRRRYGLYRGLGATQDSGYESKPQAGLCAPALRGRVDNMRDFDQVQAGVLPFYGWVLAQPEGIERVLVRIDGREVAVKYGHPRPDVKRVLGHLINDPQYPLVGFRGKIDTRQLSNGVHEVAFVGVTHWGREEVFRRLSLEVAN